MTSRLNPYISFADNAREAIEFYASVFGGVPTISTFGEFGMEGVNPDGVMHSMLVTDLGFTIMAADTPVGMGIDRVEGNNITVSLSGDDEVLRTYFEGLAEDGTILVPLEKQMWGDEFGQLVDKFGIAWMVNLSPAAQA